MKKILKSLILIITLSFYINVNAATGYINVKSSSSSVIVGKSFNVSVTISSSVPLGSWEYTINYNPSLLKLESGNQYIVDYGDGVKKTATYTYKFKALASGNANVGVKSFAAYAWGEQKMTLTSGSSTVRLLTQAQLEASYSKNNNLSSLAVDEQTLNPIFNKDTLNYTVELSPNIEKINITGKVEDGRSSISGLGSKDVAEGDNKFDIIVTAQNGSTKKYTINAIVKDPKPIEVTTSNGEKKVIVKRERLLEAPTGFIKNTTNINDTSVPSLYNQENQMILVGLKNKDGKIMLYIYEKANNVFTPYIELKFNKLRILPLSLKLDNKLFKNYKKTKINIDNIDIEAYKINASSKFAVFYGRDIDSASSNYYIYDSKEKSVIRFYNDESKILENKLNKENKFKTVLIITNILTLAILLVYISINIIQKNKHKENIDLEIEDKDKKKKKRKKC